MTKDIKKSRKQYFWEKPIKKIVSNVVFFEDGTEKVLSDKQLEYLITETPIDPSAFRDLVLDNVTPELLKVFEDHNVTKWDVQAIVWTLIGTYNHYFNTAVGKAFGTYEDGKHPESFPEQISYLDILKFKNS